LPVRGHERFLSCIQGIRAITQHPKCHGEHPILVAPHEVTERGTASFRGAIQ
jgi:hypothetical protein